MSIVTEKFHVGGMQCPGCESILEEALGRLHGVRQVRADYAAETVEVVYDARKTTMPAMERTITEAGYELRRRLPPSRTVWRTLLSVLLGLGGIALILYAAPWAAQFRWPDFDQNLSYGLLFVVGLLTGFHCVGMCGGFVLSYTARGASRGKHSFALAHLTYGVGKTVSYTVIGGLFGLLGSVVAFTPMLRGIAGVVAGVFLVLMALSMLRWFPSLRLGIRMPAFLRRFVQGEARRHRSPLAIGLLNGLMIACGPLQAMYVMAAGTGSFIEGAKRLFVFGVGTLPVLLGFGMMASLLSHRASEKILKVSAMLVMIIGLMMINRGLILSGTGYDVHTLSAVARVHVARWLDELRERMPAEAGQAVIRMTVTKSGYRPNSFVLRQNTPVKWVIDGRELTNCNRRIEVPALGLEIALTEGIQTIEFVPREAGVIPWSCWMGMLQGSFIVQPDGHAEPSEDELGQPTAE